MHSMMKYIRYEIRTFICLLLLSVCNISAADEQPRVLNIWLFPIYNNAITMSKMSPLIASLEEDVDIELIFRISSDIKQLKQACQKINFDIVLIPIHAYENIEIECHLEKIAKSISSSHIYFHSSVEYSDIVTIGIVRYTEKEAIIKKHFKEASSLNMVYLTNAAEAITQLSKREVDAIYMLDSIMENVSESIYGDFLKRPKTKSLNGAFIYLSNYLEPPYKENLKNIILNNPNVAGAFNFKKI